MCGQHYTVVFVCHILCVFSVMRGIGEMDMNQPTRGSSVLPVDDSHPYLILDIRDRDAYDTCHIITGKYY